MSASTSRILLGKGIGGGFPLGAVLATEELAQFLTPGTHGTTYGGNPLACAAGMAVLEEILKPGFLEHVRAVGEAFGALLDAVTKSAPDVFDSVRGIGLMRGLHCKVPVGEVMAAATEQGLLSVSAGDNVLRLVPPLIVTEDECREACDRLVRAADAICEAKLTTQEKVS